jgi:hypothetical protein
MPPAIHSADPTPEGRYLAVSCVTDSTIVMGEPGFYPAPATFVH